MSTLKSSSENLTLNADGSGNDIIFQSNGSNVATLDQAGTLTTTKLTLDQNSNDNALSIDAENTTAHALNVESDVATTGSIARFYSNSSTTGTRSLVKVINDNPSATGTTVLYVQNDSTGLCADFVGDKIRAADGILFGTDTAAANALDDYEEGTYVPTILGSTSGNYTCSTNDTLSYTKVGRLVHVFGKLEPNTDNSLTHLMLFSLPFTSASDTKKESEGVGSCFIRNTGSTDIKNTHAVNVGAGQTDFYINWHTDAGASENVADIYVDAAFDVWFGFTYLAA